jgi:putative serine protease PepD
MDEDRPRDHSVLIAVITGVIGLLLGLCGGGAIAGFAGYALGRQAASQGATRAVPFLAPGPSLPSVTPNIPGAPPGPSQQGVAVQDVVAGSPAEAAGIQPGDVLTRLDNTALGTGQSLAGILAQHKPGDQVRITLQRQGSTRTVTVTLGAAPANPGKAYLGIRYSEP